MWGKPDVTFLLDLTNKRDLSDTTTATPNTPHTYWITNTPLPRYKTMQILYVHRKGPHLNTAERFYIHKEAAQNNHLNDEHTITNKIFDTILRGFRGF
jgi:hypothetical protein